MDSLDSPVIMEEKNINKDLYQQTDRYRSLLALYCCYICSGLRKQTNNIVSFIRIEKQSTTKTTDSNRLPLENPIIDRLLSLPLSWKYRSRRNAIYITE